MTNFWDSNVWGLICLVGVLLLSLLTANMIKKTVPFLRNSLVPTSVLGGFLLLFISVIFELVFKTSLFDSAVFSVVDEDGAIALSGSDILEVITYHALALGFIATVFKPGHQKFSKERSVEIFNTGVTTVATYLLQGFLGLGATLLWGLLYSDFFTASGALLPFGFGQGTGQALNYGNIYETDWGFVGGKSFGLSVAALGFLSASVGGVIYLSFLRRKYNIKQTEEKAEKFAPRDIQGKDEIPMNGSIDKLTVQVGIVLSTYLITYLFMKFLGSLIPGLQSVLYGFNFLFGVLFATAVMGCLNLLRRFGIVKKEYINPFLMKRISGFFFDLMIVAGIAAIRIDFIKQYWLILMILCVIGAFSTFFYNRFVAKKCFPNYSEEQFLAMYGMLTGTASTGIVLLREIDPDFKSPVAENLVYQNLPAIVFGFPMMFLGTFAPQQPFWTFVIILASFVVMNLLLFRRQLFMKKKKSVKKG